MSESTPELPPYLADESTWTNAGGPGGGSLYTLPEVQAYQAEVAAAAREGREPALEDPTKRKHPAEADLDNEVDTSPPHYPHNAKVDPKPVEDKPAPAKKAVAKKAVAKKAVAKKAVAKKTTAKKA